MFADLDSRVRNISLIVGTTFFLMLLDSSIIVTSLPRMAQTFNVAAVDLSVAISVYLLALSAFIPLSGWLADRFGGHRIFLVSVVIFVAASVACGSATTLTEFMIARACQGFGGALMLPVGRLIILHTASKTELSRAMVILTWPAMLAPVLGPIVGGWITTYISWRWNFFINLPIGALAFILAWKMIPPMPTTEKRPFDLLGFLLVAGGLSGLLYGMEAFAHEWLSPLVITVLVGGSVLLAVAAVYHLRHSPNPLLNLRSFRLQTFAMSTIGAGPVLRIGINGMPFLLPLMLQVCFQLTPIQAGGYLFVYFLGNLMTKSLTIWLLQLCGFRAVLVVNGVLCGLSIGFSGFISPALADVIIMPLLFIAGVTRSVAFSALNTLTYADITGPLRSSATTLGSMLMQVSMMLSITLSVCLMQLSKWLGQRAELSYTDFYMAFGVMGGLVLLASLAFLQLPRSAGAEVSGHKPKHH